MKTRFHFYADPSHGWLKVQKAELENLNLSCPISSFSYVSPDGRFYFLEEDRDASIFIAAYQDQVLKNDQKVTFNEHYSNRSSRIRNYSQFPKV